MITMPTLAVGPKAAVTGTNNSATTSSEPFHIALRPAGAFIQSDSSGFSPCATL